MPSCVGVVYAVWPSDAMPPPQPITAISPCSAPIGESPATVKDPAALQLWPESGPPSARVPRGTVSSDDNTCSYYVTSRAGRLQSFRWRRKDEKGEEEEMEEGEEEEKEEGEEEGGGNERG
ncbi:unnamed protein product [Pleuronectes platessa]|uniref:Uncharacterized protein n=1 Tax=Pleuronectes platessa TaxID=8262 RepID=A0A9N7VVL6_PLEPL|nr:unnamed protein product [Pleuronectes platessa]